MDVNDNAPILNERFTVDVFREPARSYSSYASSSLARGRYQVGALAHAGGRQAH